MRAAPWSARATVHALVLADAVTLAATAPLDVDGCQRVTAARHALAALAQLVATVGSRP